MKDIRREAQQLKQDCKLMLGDGVELDFGRINGVEISHCVINSNVVCYGCLKRYGTLQEAKEDET